MSDRLLLKPAEGAAEFAVSRRKFYDLMKTNEDIRAAVVEIPGLRGVRIRRDLLEKAIQKLSLSEAA